MIPELRDEVKQLVESIRTFVQKEVLPVEQSAAAGERELPVDQVRELQAKAKAAGYWMLAAPVKFGGGGLSTFEMAAVNEEAAKYKYSFSTPIFGRTPPVVLYEGTEQQIQKYVIPAIENGWSTYTAISEPSGGSDPARAIQTVARRDGDHYVLNGTKLWTTNAESAAFGVVYARTGVGRSGISAFVVEADTPGVTVREVPVIRNHWTNEVHYTDCRVPVANLIGKEGDGFRLAQSWTLANRLYNATFAIGVSVDAMRIAQEWAVERETFGARLATRQATQFALADSYIETAAARLLVQEAAYACDADFRSPTTRMKVSMAKVYATEAGFRVVDRMMQVLGGMGMAKELPLEHWLRDLRVSRIVEGPSEVHRYLVARELLGAAATGAKS